MCNTRIDQKKNFFRSNLPAPVAFSVRSGAGCYLGHMSVTMIDSDIREFSIDPAAELSAEKLSNLPADVAAKLLTTVNRPCT